MRLDGPAIRDILELTIAGHGVIGTWVDVIMPVLIGIGERYETTKRFIEVEHLISRSVTEVLSSIPRPSSRRLPQVLLAAADEEQHTLPLEALEAALAEAGVPTRLLGARVPPQALADAIARTGPSAVVVWSQLPETADPAQLTKILTDPHRPVLVAVAGPGWAKDDLPPGVTLLGSLSDAVATLSAAAGPS
jgi:methanogenic corrinoid protein MtbC1